MCIYLNLSYLVCKRDHSQLLSTSKCLDDCRGCDHYKPTEDDKPASSEAGFFLH